MERQIKPYTLDQYAAAGCIVLARNGQIDVLGAGIHGATGGMPCNGCFMLPMGCSAYKTLRGDATVKTQTQEQPSETVRQEAARRGLSIGEVRRQRHG